MVNWRLFVYARESAKVCESEWSLLPPASSINPKGRRPCRAQAFAFYISYYDICCVSHARNVALMLIKAAAHTVVNSIRITEKLRNWFVATAPAPDFAHAPACCFDKPVWHYVKS